MNSFWRFSFIFFSYYALCALFQLVTVSLIAFFHFLLDHKLGVIEDWVFDKGWEIVIWVKVWAFIVLQKFIQLPSSSRQPFRDLIVATWKRPSRKLFALSVASFLVILLVSSPVSNDIQNANAFKGIVSFVSCTILILLDVLLFLSLRFHHGFGHWESRFSVLLMALLFWIGNSLLFPFAQGFSFQDFFLHILVMQLALWERDNWSDPLFFVILVIAPTISFLGHDPVWGNKFSLFVTNQELAVASAISLLFMGTAMIWWKSKTEQIA